MRFLPLAVVCLLAAQVAQARTLQAPKKAWDPSKKLWLQFALTLKGETCAALPNFSKNFVAAAKSDLVVALAASEASPAAIATVRGAAVGTPCVDAEIDGAVHAQFIVNVNYNGTLTTNVRDTLWSAARQRICSGGFSRTVWVNVGQLVANKDVAYNNASRLNPNAAGNAMPYVPAAGTCGTPPPPTPSPSPAPDASPSPAPDASPSPAPEASPSPAPEPSPSPAPPQKNCSAEVPNSGIDAAGNCVCNQPGFAIEAYNSTTLAQCLADGITVCPAGYPVEVKDNSSPTPKITSCITADGPCPADQWSLYNGATLDECRPVSPTGVCSYFAPGRSYDMAIKNNAAVTIGCVTSASNECPFVAFRTANSSWTMSACKDVSVCDPYNLVNQAFTVPATTIAGKLTDCLTLAADNACPDVPGLLSFPLEVMRGSPTSPACGSNAFPCDFTNGASRTVRCLEAAATCPDDYNLPVMGCNGTNCFPTIQECRLGRANCDLTATGMGTTANDVNAAQYSIKVTVSQIVVGCILEGVTNCPTNFQDKVFVNGNLTECKPNGTTPPLTCTSVQIPVYNAGNTITACLDNQTQPCPTESPLAIRDTQGLKTSCQAASTCPGGYTPFFAEYPGGSGTIIVTNCYPTSIATSCNLPSVIGSATGTDGVYNIPAQTSGTPVVSGCILAGTTQCPTTFPVTFITKTASTTTLTSCSPAGSVTSCSLPAINLVAASGQLSGCVTLSGTTECPTAFPVEVQDTSIVPNATDVKACLAQDAACPASYPFYLMSNILIKCVLTPVALGSCNNVTDFTGAEIFSPDGLTFTGCIVASQTSCPALFPVFMLDATNSSAAVVKQCRASVATCPSVTSQLQPIAYPTTYYSANATNPSIVGCQTAGSTCMSSTVPVSNTATSAELACLSAALTSCASVTVPQPGYTFSLYDRDAVNNQAVLRRCIKPVSGATNCSSVVAFGDYTVALKSADGSTLDGCYKGTVCPTSQVPAAWTFALYAKTNATDTTAVLSQCRVPTTPTVTVVPGCAAIAGAAGFNVELSATGGSSTPLQGCLETGASCPDSFSKQVFNATGSLASCQTTLTSCGTNIPLCTNSTIAADANCPAGDLYGCLASTATKCTVDNYGIFVSALTNGTTPTGVLKACYTESGGPTACPLTGVYTVTAYAGASNTTALAGCTDTDAAICQSYWQSISGNATYICS